MTNTEQKETGVLTGKVLIEAGGTYWPHDITSVNKQLPIGVYTLMRDNQRGLYLRKSEDFTVPPKIYGSDIHITERWLRAWHDTPEDKNLGIILHGVKGSGKTITAKYMCMVSKMPVILIQSPFAGDELNTFMATPAFKNCIVFIDEFDKVYGDRDTDGPADAQSALLTLLDGTTQTHLLFIFTINSSEKLDDFLVNRLGRIRYFRSFPAITSSVLKEVIADRLKNQAYTEELVRVAGMLGEPTLDLICGIIDECNRFDESPIESVKHLNILTTEIDYQIFEKSVDGDWIQVSWNDLDIRELKTGTMPKVSIRRTTFSHLPGFRVDFTDEEAAAFQQAHSTLNLSTVKYERAVYDTDAEELGTYLFKSKIPGTPDVRIGVARTKLNKMTF